ncbi:MAG: glycosyltransferase family 4 protein [Firmicutes bacterium]|uniref:Glycosyl transferase family 1 domain-containing protein n=1 Tax=Sulfobacillus benefaciens TaxID=453960 RepID=A0A2T2X344_9FIRM|nr:glycosyltransferase family 4 protein [Bacillota bacterium]MCL5014513.1 glycosyltransferase family 4 protein [Bacillota bacterium]PSR28899.1 MAG: hypothetical protein C7B43_09460 [Sulfobacillus benefaciens]
MQVILVGPLPPPCSGPEMVTETLLESGAPWIHFRHVDLSSGLNRGKGRWTVGALVRTAKQLTRLTWVLWTQRKESKIVHLPLSQSTTGVLRDVALIRLAGLFHYRIVVQFHGGDFLRFYWSSSFRARILKVLESLDILLVFDKELIKQFPFVNEDKIRVLVNPVPANWVRAWPSLSRLAPVQDSQPLVILYMSHLSVAKGLVDLFEALRLLPDEKEWEVHLAGEIVDIERNIVWPKKDMNYGWDQARHIIHLNHWEGRVHYHGVVTDEDKIALFAQSHVLVLPSYSEGMPVVILEAMYAGLGVIASKVGAIGSMISPAFLHDPGDVAQLADKLWRMTPEKARRVGQTNRRMMERGYLANQVIPQLQRVYESLEPGMRTSASQKLRVIRPGKKMKPAGKTKRRT